MAGPQRSLSLTRVDGFSERPRGCLRHDEESKSDPKLRITNEPREFLSHARSDQSEAPSGSIFAYLGISPPRWDRLLCRITMDTAVRTPDACARSCSFDRSVERESDTS